MTESAEYSFQDARTETDGQCRLRIRRDECAEDALCQKGKGKILWSILQQPDGVGFGVEEESFRLTVKVRPSKWNLRKKR